MAYRSEWSKTSKRYHHEDEGRSAYKAAQGDDGTELITPDTMRVKLRYVDAQAYTGVTPADAVYRGNSVFDPNFAAGGLQPAGFDEWALLYNTYRVMASKCKIQAIAGNAVPTRVTLWANTQGSATGLTAIQQCEQPYCEHYIMGNSGGGHDKATLTKYMSTSEIWGVPVAQVRTDPSFSSGVTNNPSSQWYWNIAVDSSFPGTTVSTIIDYEITYYVEFFNRKQLVDS